ncbi:MAG TPA: hypothetical protein VFW96_13585 [Thermomicrobiales bacterium]|nr:hypothetical protein [Thermomicrobiales bacterium]
MLAATMAAPALFHDTVAQVELPAWSRGRVTLVGDAGGCVSLLGGQGASLALAGAHALAQELGRAGGDVAGALARYQARVQPAVARDQATGRRFAHWLVPGTPRGVALHDLITRLTVQPLAVPLARRVLGGRVAVL